MNPSTRSSVAESVGYGALAGVVFAIVEVVAAAMMGDPPLMPFRMFASVLLGREALMAVSLGTALVVGTIVHLVLSCLFGLIYGLLLSRASPSTRGNLGVQAGLGLVFGLAVWVLNFQIIARIAYPWFLGTPQLLQALMHAVAFGLPLGLTYGAAQRRAVARPV